MGNSLKRRIAVFSHKYLEADSRASVKNDFDRRWDTYAQKRKEQQCLHVGLRQWTTRLRC